MIIYIKRFLPACALFFSCFLINAEKYALIISLRSGEQKLSDASRESCQQLKALLGKTGFDKKNIFLFFEGGGNNFEGSVKPTVANIEGTIKKLKSSLTEKDSLWVFLFGHANLNRRGLSLATKGQRLKGEKFGDWLDAIPARQFIFCLNRQSYPLMRILCNRSDRFVFCATNDPGQLNPPLLPKFLLQNWLKKPESSVFEAFNEGARQTENYYIKNGVAISEVPQLYDGGKILNYPFEKQDANILRQVSLLNPGNEARGDAGKKARQTAKAAQNTSDKKEEPPSLSELEDLMLKKEDFAALTGQFPLHAATDESRAILKNTSRLAGKYPGFAACYESLNIDFTVNSDLSTITVEDYTIALFKDSASEMFGRLFLKDSPPYYEIQVKSARIIYPDGSFREIKDWETSNALRHTRFHQLKFAGAKAGCVIKYVLKHSAKPKNQLPFFYRDFIIQQHLPLASCKLNIKIPDKQYFRYKLRRSDAKPLEKNSEYSKELSFSFKELPGMEPLPYDPPFQDCVVRLQLSSMKDWEQFREWVGRIMKGADEVDPETAALAKALTGSSKNDAEKVKALYEFLCELRYETTPLGARAFRPRLPKDVCSARYGDCKDKANALVALANSLGIKGFVVLVNRNASTDPDFPGWQFNHAVAFFPSLSGYENGLWCDATDGSTPFASLPPGDIGRYGFILLDKGYEFRKITEPGDKTNSFVEDISITVTKDNKATAKFAIKASGLSDYQIRKKLKRASPLQRINIIQQIVNCSFTGLSVKTVKISDPENISNPISVDASCESESAELLLANIAPPCDFWAAVAAPERDRPLLLNDNQPFSIVQKVTVTGVKTGSIFKSESGSSICDTFVKSRNEGDSYQREISIKIKKPLISEKEYPGFRKQIIDWYSNMRRSEK